MLIELLFVHHFEFLSAILHSLRPQGAVCIQTLNCIQISLVREESHFS